VHWAVCTGIFGKRDIGRIEREFLDVLDFELNISEADIMAHHNTIMSLASPSPRHRSHGTPGLTLPELELAYPSGSPTSTEASFSPRTPPASAIVEIPMDVDPRSKSEQYRAHEAQYESYPVAPVRVHVPQPRQEKRSSHSSSTFRLLRSIPFPRPFGHTSSSSSSSSSSRAELQVPPQSITQQGRCQLIPPFAAQPSSQVCA
jgi:hypothetical protein